MDIVSNELNRLAVWLSMIAAVAVCIIGIACIIPHKTAYPREAEITDRLPRFALLCKQFKTVTGIWPTNTATISAVLRITNRAELYDVWSNSYGFYPTSDKTALYLICYGADGKPGGYNENADITMLVK